MSERLVGMTRGERIASGFLVLVVALAVTLLLSSLFAACLAVFKIIEWMWS